MKKKNGFTLIELVVSIGLLSIIIIPLLSVFYNGYISDKYVGMREKALYDAQRIITYIQSGKANNNFDFQTLTSFNVKVVSNPLNGINNLYKTNVTITYPKTLNNHTVTLTTLTPIDINYTPPVINNPNPPFNLNSKLDYYNKIFLGILILNLGLFTFQQTIFGMHLPDFASAYNYVINFLVTNIQNNILKVFTYDNIFLWFLSLFFPNINYSITYLNDKDIIQNLLSQSTIANSLPQVVKDSLSDTANLFDTIRDFTDFQKIFKG